MIQAKLTIGQPGDKYEQEADRVAEQVMRMPEPTVAARKSVERGSGGTIQRNCSKCDEEVRRQLVEEDEAKLRRQVKEEDEEEAIQTKPMIGEISPLIQRQAEPPEEEQEIQAKPLANSMTPFLQRQVGAVEEEEEGSNSAILQAEPLTGHTLPQLQRQMESAEEEEEDKTLQTKPTSVPSPSPDLQGRLSVMQGRGQPMPTSLRRLFEPRFGYDFGTVRLHTGPYAAGIAGTLSAQAFTLGRDITFGSGRYEPGTTRGRALLAHELTHVIQQTGGGSVGKAHAKPTAPGSRIQRRLSVNPHHPASILTSYGINPRNDPARTLTSAQRYSMMDTLIQQLCPQYEVDRGNGAVVSKTRQTLSRSDLQRGSQPTGCCCLSVLTDWTAANWTIHVSQLLGPRNVGGNGVVLSPTTTPIEFGSWTTGTPSQPSGGLAFQGQVPAAGHELCGHAALHEINAHPTGNRLTTDVHDPTVRLENAIGREQSVPTPAADERGLAASGPHRGESVDRITIRGYPLNRHQVSSLPTPEREKARFAANYITANQGFADILGHSDSRGPSWAKQRISDLRANTMKQFLKRQGVVENHPTHITSAGAPVSRFTRVEGLSDRQPPSPPRNASQANWRRVDILVAGFPAGAQRPPPGTPTTVAPHTRSPGLSTARGSSDPCIRHLARTVYP